MNLQKKIRAEMLAAMKSREKERLDAVRYLVAQIQNLQIELQKEPSDEEIIKLLGKEAKKRQEAIELYKKGGRQDLVAREQLQLELIQEYLPKQMSDEELKKIVKGVVAENNGVDFGRLMGMAMGRIKGGADGKRVAEMLQKLIES